MELLSEEKVILEEFRRMINLDLKKAILYLEQEHQAKQHLPNLALHYAIQISSSLVLGFDYVSAIKALETIQADREYYLPALVIKAHLLDSNEFINDDLRIQLLDEYKNRFDSKNYWCRQILYLIACSYHPIYEMNGVNCSPYKSYLEKTILYDPSNASAYQQLSKYYEEKGDYLNAVINLVKSKSVIKVLPFLSSPESTILFYLEDIQNFIDMELRYSVAYSTPGQKDDLLDVLKLLDKLKKQLK